MSMAGMSVEACDERDLLVVEVRRIGKETMERAIGVSAPHDLGIIEAIVATAENGASLGFEAGYRCAKNEVNNDGSVRLSGRPKDWR